MSVISGVAMSVSASASASATARVTWFCLINQIGTSNVNDFYR